jgi:hypothetical protein
LRGRWLVVWVLTGLLCWLVIIWLLLQFWGMIDR